MTKGEIQRDASGLRMTHERGALDAERVHEGGYEALAVADGMVGWVVGEAEAGQVGRDDAQAMRGERGKVASPYVGGRAERRPMQQHDGRAFAFLEVADVQPVDAGRSFHGSATSSRTPSGSAKWCCPSGQQAAKSLRRASPSEPASGSGRRCGLLSPMVRTECFSFSRLSTSNPM